MNTANESTSISPDGWHVITTPLNRALALQLKKFRVQRGIGYVETSSDRLDPGAGRDELEQAHRNVC